MTLLNMLIGRASQKKTSKTGRLMVANQNQAGLALGMDVDQEYQVILLYSPS
jgi:hypothetical protein